MNWSARAGPSYYGRAALFCARVRHLTIFNLLGENDLQIYES